MQFRDDDDDEQETSYYLKLTSREMQKDRAGIGAIISRLIAYLSIHESLHKNSTVRLINRELDDIFLLPKPRLSPIKNINLEDIYRNIQDLSKVNAHTLNDSPEMIQRSRIFNKYFGRVRPDRALNDTPEFLTNSIGVHLRGTDKSGEVSPASPHRIFTHIDSRLRLNQSLFLYLATDDLYYRELLLERYGEKRLKFNSELKISNNGKPLHFKRNRTNLNIEVVSEIVRLSNCSELLWCYSNVSYLALIRNYEKYHYQACLNERLLS